MMVEFLVYALIGVLAGIASGLFGVGGGVISIPCLFFTFKWLHPDEAAMYIAIGTSLTSMVFSSFISYFIHEKQGTVDHSIAKYMVIGGVLGAIIGPLFAVITPEAILQVIFGVFLSWSGFHIFRTSHIKDPDSLPKYPRKSTLTFLGFVISTLSSLLGVGGGLFTMPLLAHFKFPIKKCIGTSAAISFLITFLGALTYIGMEAYERYHGKVAQFIDIQAFIMISLFGMLSAPLGVKLMHILPASKIKSSFGCVLAAAGIYMILRSPLVFGRTWL